MSTLKERLAARGTTPEKLRREIQSARAAGYKDLQTAQEKGGFDLGFPGKNYKPIAPKGVITKAEIVSMEKQPSNIKSAISGVWQGLTPWDESKGQTATVGGSGIMAAELLVPGVYTARHWNKMSNGERAFSIAMDAISIMPSITAAARGAKAVQTAGKAARLKGAVQGVKQDLILQVRAPVDMVLHPVETVKGTARSARSFVENVAHPSKIPEAVLTTTDQTVRLKITKDMTPEQAMQTRDKLMELVVKGEKPIVEIPGGTVELSRSPFMKEVGGGVVHTTAQGDKFVSGLVVERKIDKTGKVMPLSEQGLFVANEPLPRFAQKSAFGMTGEAPTIIVMSEDVAKHAIPSGKTYKSHLGQVSEMELKLPLGAEVPAPKQKLFTRYGPSQQKIEIFLDKPLSKKQILKLKGMATIEDLKTPFKPSIQLTKKSRSKLEAGSLSEDMMDGLIDMLKSSGNKQQARALTLSRDIVKTNRAVPKGIDELTGRSKPDKVEAQSTSSTSDRASSGGAEEPRRDDQEIPRRDDRETPRRDDQETPRRDDRETPRRDDRETPRRDDRETPRRDDRRTPRQDEDKRTPRDSARDDSTVPPRVPIDDDDEKKPILVLPGGPGDEPKKKEYTAASVAHKQGMGYWIYNPPYGADDREFSMEKPYGATIEKDAKTAFETIQSLGGPVDLNATYDMGIVDVHIGKTESKPSAKKGRKAISFTRDTDQTYGKLKKNQRPPSTGSKKVKRSGRRRTKVGPYYVGSGGGVSRKPID